MKFYLLLFLIAPCFLFSQKNIQLSLQRNTDNSATINYAKSKIGSYCIKLHSIILNEKPISSLKKTADSETGIVTTILPNPGERITKLTYKSSIALGKCDCKPDFKFTYTLPFKKGKKIKVSAIKSPSHKIKNKQNTENWQYFKFTPKSEIDSVFAMRRGTVIKVVNNNIIKITKDLSYKSKSNYIIVEHKDGTLARYDIFKKNSIVVRSGDQIFPGDFLGIIGKYGKNKNPQLRISFYYLNPKAPFLIQEKQKLGEEYTPNIYFSPVFLTKNGVKKLQDEDIVISEFNNDLVRLEMTKKEKKKH